MLGRSDYCLVPSGYCSGLLEAETGRVRSSDEIWAQNGGDPYSITPTFAAFSSSLASWSWTSVSVVPNQTC